MSDKRPAHAFYQFNTPETITAVGHAKVSKTAHVWALAGGTEAGAKTQIFEVNYSGLPGVNADQFEP